MKQISDFRTSLLLPLILFATIGVAIAQTNTFTEVYHEPESDIIAFQMTTENIGWIILDGKIKKTVDGGATWNTVLTLNINKTNFRDFLFVSESIGFVVSRYEIIKTTDGGLTWSSKYFYLPETYEIGTYYSLREISMNGNLGFVGVNTCKTNEDFNSTCPKWYLKTNDGGETWTKITTPPNLYSFERINCDDPTELYGFNVARQSFGVGGSIFNGVQKSTDSGTSWQGITPLLNVLHSELDRYNGKKYFSATVALHQSGNDYFIAKSIETSSLTNLNLSEYVFIDENIHFALGKSSTINGFQQHIYRTNDGGKTWFFINDYETSDYVVQNYLFLQSVSSTVWVISESNKIYKMVFRKTPPGLMQVLPITSIQNPNGIALNAQKQVFFTEYDNNSVRRYDPVTHQTTLVAGGNGRGSESNKLYDPTGIQIIGNELYIVNFFGNTIRKWTIGALNGIDIAGGSRANSDGTYTRLLYRPNYVVFDDLGDMYITSVWDNRIVKWTPGAPDGVTILGGNGNGSAPNQFKSPSGIFRSQDGTIYISDTFNHRVQKFLPGQTNGTTVAGNGLEGNNTKRLSKPVAIYVTNEGSIYVLENGNHRITKWQEGGSKGEIIVGNISAGNNLTSLDQPRDFVFDETTNTFYIADNQNNRIMTYSLPCLNSTVQSGNWNSPAVWSCGTIPTVLDAVRINSPHTITLPTDYTATAKSVELQGSIQYSTNAQVQLGQQ